MLLNIFFFAWNDDHMHKSKQLKAKGKNTYKQGFW